MVNWSHSMSSRCLKDLLEQDKLVTLDQVDSQSMVHVTSSGQESVLVPGRRHVQQNHCQDESNKCWLQHPSQGERYADRQWQSFSNRLAETSLEAQRSWIRITRMVMWVLVRSVQHLRKTYNESLTLSWPHVSGEPRTNSISREPLTRIKKEKKGRRVTW